MLTNTLFLNAPFMSGVQEDKQNAGDEDDDDEEEGESEGENEEADAVR